MKQFRTYHLAIKLYRASSALHLPHHLQDQLLRASSSVVLNLAEGAGKRTMKDQRKFYDIAFGSLRECQAILELAELSHKKAGLIADQTAAHLYKLLTAMK